MTDDEDGLRIVFTPVQLAAVMQGASITEPEGWWGRLANRVEGGFRLIGGGVELVGASGLLLAPEPTLLTKAAGVGLALHGSDTASTGMVEIWTGRHHVTMTEQAVAAAARAIGYDPEKSDALGANVDILVPMAVLGPLGAVRATAVRSGRFVVEESRWLPAERSRFVNLEAEEASGGHAIARHVGKDEAYLRGRLADPKFKGAAASSWRTLEEAEKYISRALMAQRPQIEQWAATAAVGTNRKFVYVAGEVVGYGVARATNMMTSLSKVAFRLEKVADGNKIYFVLTAFPDL